MSEKELRNFVFMLVCFVMLVGSASATVTMDFSINATDSFSAVGVDLINLTTTPTTNYAQIDKVTGTFTETAGVSGSFEYLIDSAAAFNISTWTETTDGLINRGSSGYGVHDGTSTGIDTGEAIRFIFDLSNLTLGAGQKLVFGEVALITITMDNAAGLIGQVQGGSPIAIEPHPNLAPDWALIDFGGVEITDGMEVVIYRESDPTVPDAWGAGVFRTLEFDIVPEPATMCLLGLGGLFVCKRKRA